MVCICHCLALVQRTSQGLQMQNSLWLNLICLHAQVHPYALSHLRSLCFEIQRQLTSCLFLEGTASFVKIRFGFSQQFGLRLTSLRPSSRPLWLFICVLLYVRGATEQIHPVSWYVKLFTSSDLLAQFGDIWRKLRDSKWASKARMKKSNSEGKNKRKKEKKKEIKFDWVFGLQWLALLLIWSHCRSSVPNKSY